MQLDRTIPEPRRHPRTLSPTEAVVVTHHGVRSFTVSNLSVAGALLVGNHPLIAGQRIEVILRLPLYPEVRLEAHVIRCDRGEDGDEIAISFVHHDDRTEDHIQSALLSELERSSTHGRIVDVV